MQEADLTDFKEVLEAVVGNNVKFVDLVLYDLPFNMRRKTRFESTGKALLGSSDAEYYSNKAEERL